MLVDEAGVLENEWELGSQNRLFQPLSSSVLILHWGGVATGTTASNDGTRVMPFDFTRMQLRWNPAVVGAEVSESVSVRL